MKHKLMTLAALLGTLCLAGVILILPTRMMIHRQDETVGQLTHVEGDQPDGLTGKGAQHSVASALYRLKKKQLVQGKGYSEYHTYNNKEEALTEVRERLEGTGLPFWEDWITGDLEDYSGSYEEALGTKTFYLSRYSSNGASDLSITVEETTQTIVRAAFGYYYNYDDQAEITEETPEEKEEKRKELQQIMGEYMVYLQLDPRDFQEVTFYPDQKGTGGYAQGMLVTRYLLYSPEYQLYLYLSARETRYSTELRMGAVSLDPKEMERCQ